ncbi:MAG: hypothetical protein EOP07_20340 [Proteobacteria bacterium]|nr:MAG: hypothetical protein EOP07_20340 [Pseudomonadota bacterium]
MNDMVVAPKATNVVAASAWMVGITLALFFLPLLNGLIGGFVGGYKVGSPGRAIGAAVLPAAIATAGLWAILSSFDHPVLGFLAGVAVGVLVLLADVGIFIGAFIGGFVSNRRVGR